MTESVHALSGAYVVDALDDAERDQFERHLPGCLDCQAEVASLREAAAAMAEAVSAPPPAHLRDSVLASIRTVRPLPPEVEHDADARGDDVPSAPPVDAEPTGGPGGTVVPLRPRRRRLAGLSAAAAVVAVLGAGVVWQQVDRPDTSTTQLTAADRVLGATDVKHVSLDLAGGATATVFRSEAENGAVLVTRRMAAAPDGKVWQLWLRDAAGTMHPAGLMQGAGDKKVLIDGDVATADAVGITAEPAGGSPQPTSQPVAMFDLAEATA